MKQTPKEKAEELVLNYMPYVDWNGFNEKRALINAKQCALIAVDEILRIRSVNKDDILSNYWEEVEEEIEKL
jgi:hypothetical protein